ncbi:hypothetical protein [Gordonia sihwensis]|uniref:hypothetical protein n=1 Tax=Gordonia sihwensis TaxID=173559 RepID=UPI001C92E559|nr:hypothetical protein [Gordonia sihwensis]
MNEQYWEDLKFEGEKLTIAAEGAPRDLSRDIATTRDGRAETRRDGERYRTSVGKPRTLDPDREEHQLQDVIDAYRWNHPAASRVVRRGIGFERSGR